ncbi:MAG: protein-S-isoprenylcysteine O-methyltransferase [Pseudomonadota bacterium]
MGEMKRVFPMLGWMIAITFMIGVVLRWQINGWASLGWLAFIISISIIRAPHSKRNKSNIITEKKSVSVERVLLALVAIGGTFIPLIHLATGMLSFANYRLPDWAAIIGFILIVPTLWLFWRSHTDLGQNWSVTVEAREGHTLITNGVYGRIRHPMYTAIWMGFLLQPLFVQNWVAGFTGILSFGLMYLLRVPYEENMMREQFGESYEAYCSRTGRLLPKFS